MSETNLKDGEQYRVNHLIPSLSTWNGKKVGVRGQYVPKDVEKLYTAYKEAKTKAISLEATDEWRNAGEPELFPGKSSELKLVLSTNIQSPAKKNSKFCCFV